MILYIKNMVCLRCKMAVQSVLEEYNIPYHKIELGKAVLCGVLTPDERNSVNTGLSRYKLELMEDKKKILVERIKVLIIELAQSSHDEKRLKLSEYLSKNLDYDYTYLSNTFSELERSTIERFYIVTRVEKVKELIIYEDLNITEIAYRLHYSSVSHLCLQFRKVTGHTPSMFRKLCESEDFVWRTGE